MINTEIISNPVNWIKIGLMSVTFLLGLLFIVQHVLPVNNSNTGN